MNNKYIIITSIFHPTEAVRRFASLSGCQVVVVGDRKTPADWTCENVCFLSLDNQKQLGYRILKNLPYDHYCRKMVGYLYAIKMGAEIIVDTDDDNLMLPSWELPSFEGAYRFTEANLGFVNIYSYFTDEDIWPRGFPLALIKSIETKISDKNLATKKIKVGIWQGLADGDPDVDAIYRLTRGNTEFHFEARPPIALDLGTISPFNSQNTVFYRELFPLMYLPASVTFRFTDILRGLVAQPIMWLRNLRLGFTGATVFQKRNPHNYLKDFESEVPVYLHTEKVVELVTKAIRPDYSICDNLYESYKALYQNGLVAKEELELLRCWMEDLN